MSLPSVYSEYLTKSLYKWNCVNLHLVQVSITVNPRSILAMPAHQPKIKKDFNNRYKIKGKSSDMIAIEDSWPVSEAQMQKLLKSKSGRDYAETWMKECEKSYDANGLFDVPYVYQIHILIQYIYTTYVYIKKSFHSC